MRSEAVKRMIGAWRWRAGVFRTFGRAGVIPLVATLGVCATTPASLEEPLGEADVRVLFLGNSLTYSNDLPAMVQTIAEAAGHTFAYATVARANFSLEDHWNGDGQGAVSAASADFVVMQQGPSSLPANQDYLRTWTETFAPLIRESGGRPALFMVWPDDTRLFAFDAVRDAYSGAAVAVDGLFIPAGEAWREMWQADPDAALYGPDGFHPSSLGSAIAALTIFRVLFGEPVTGLPARMEPVAPGLPVIDLGVDAAVVLQAVEDAISAASGQRP